MNERPITLINAVKDGDLAWARIVVSETPMLVGGQAGTVAGGGLGSAAPSTSLSVFGLSGLPLAIGGGALVVGAAAGGYAVYDNNNGDSDDDGTTTPPPTSSGNGNTPPPVSL